MFCWWCHNRLPMTSQLPDNCDTSMWQVISNSLDINFYSQHYSRPVIKKGIYICIQKVIRIWIYFKYSRYIWIHVCYVCIVHMSLYNNIMLFTTGAPSQYPKRRLFVRSREVSKPRDWYFKLSYRVEIWQTHRQQSKCLSNFRVIGQFQIQISRLQDFTRSYEKTSFRILRRGPGPHLIYAIDTDFMEINFFNSCPLNHYMYIFCMSHFLASHLACVQIFIIITSMQMELEQMILKLKLYYNKKKTLFKRPLSLPVAVCMYNVSCQHMNVVLSIVNCNKYSQNSFWVVHTNTAEYFIVAII